MSQGLDFFSCITFCRLLCMLSWLFLLLRVFLFHTGTEGPEDCWVCSFCCLHCGTNYHSRSKWGKSELTLLWTSALYGKECVVCLVLKTPEQRSALSFCRALWFPEYKGLVWYVELDCLSRAFLLGQNIRQIPASSLAQSEVYQSPFIAGGLFQEIWCGLDQSVGHLLD